MKNILFILISLFLVSCQHEDKKTKEEITRLLTKWQGKEILFPKDITFTRYAIDTVNYEIPESKYKVLIFVFVMLCYITQHHTYIELQIQNSTKKNE
ncbi:hypothetical protein FACS189411_01230 [Bacteroidia bacterium]|nr:hypothetical protein FACS189411_01230 [Bacteroidia bacterium]